PPRLKASPSVRTGVRAIRPPGDAQPVARHGHTDLARGAIRQAVRFADLEPERRPTARPGAHAVRRRQTAPRLVHRQRDGPAHADLEARLRGLPLHTQPFRPLVSDGDRLLPPSALHAALSKEQRHDLLVRHASSAALVEPAGPFVPRPARGAAHGVVREPQRTGAGPIVWTLLPPRGEGAATRRPSSCARLPGLSPDSERVRRG